MKIKVIKLGTVGTDKATGLEGTLTHWLIDMDKAILYLFQPRGVSPETGQPVPKINLGPARLEVPEDSYEEVDIPFEILGSQVEDKASGFKGMAVEFVRHINGCFHVVIQPAGILPSTGSTVRKMDFDLRACSGDKIPTLTSEQKKASERTTPSPTGDTLDAFAPYGGQ